MAVLFVATVSKDMTVQLRKVMLNQLAKNTKLIGPTIITTKMIDYQHLDIRRYFDTIDL